MNEKEFLKELEKELREIEDEELDSIMADYKDHFREARNNKKSTKEIIAALGTPKSIAKQIRAECLIKKAENKVSLKNITKAVIASISLGFFNIAFVLGIYLGLLSLLVASFATAAAFMIGGLFSAVTIIIAPMFKNFMVTISPIGTFLISISIFCAGSLLMIGSCYLAKWFYILTIKYLKLNINIITGDNK